MRTKTKKKETEVYSESAEKASPQIPQDIFNDFLESKIKLSQVKNIKEIKCGFLWERQGLQRYRINIWQEEFENGQYCARFYIGHSWFVHYCTRTKKIIDKTIEPKPEI